MQELISVIVPIYNVENYLENCLSSICNQSYKNLEIILINDGSTDSSEKICKKYVEKDNRVRLYSCLNSGPAFARNLGISKSNGNYITFIDSDDKVDLNMIKILYDELKKNDGDISISCILDSHEKYYFDKLGYGVVNKQQFMEYLLCDYIKSYLMGKLYKKKLWDKIRFPNGKKVEDLAVLYKIFENANNIINVNKKLYYYTEDNPNSETRTCREFSGLYPRFYFNTERYEFAKKYYPQIVDNVLYQAVSYGNMSFFKIIDKTYYNNEKKEILNYFIKNKKNIIKCKQLPLYKKLEALCIMNQYETCCKFFSKLHEMKQKSDF